MDPRTRGRQHLDRRPQLPAPIRTGGSIPSVRAITQRDRYSSITSRKGPNLGRSLTRTLLIARRPDVLEHLGGRVVAEAVVATDLRHRHLLNQNFSSNLRPNLHVAVHPSPVPPVGSLRNQLASRGCWVWLFSASGFAAQCGCFRSAFTPDNHYNYLCVESNYTT